jgi:toxin ParE1/3/4
MRVRYTEPAALDFDASVDYLRKHAPSVVAEFADSVDEAVALLLQQPYSAEATDMPRVRRWYIRRFKHMLFYTIEGDELVILHIRHAARRWPWEREE